MDALGLIELYGYVPAVEALDAALKAANVRLLDVVRVKGGIVTVLVEGEVGAVKASIDASAAAAERVGKVLSVHVIPRPHEEVAQMIRITDPDNEPPRFPEGDDRYTGRKPQAEKKEEVLPQAEPVPEAAAEPEKPISEEAKPEKPVRKPVKAEPKAAKKQETAKAGEITREMLAGMTVDKIRALARELNIGNMTRAEIRFAKKTELVGKIMEFIGE